MHYHKLSHRTTFKFEHYVMHAHMHDRQIMLNHIQWWLPCFAYNIYIQHTSRKYSLHWRMVHRRLWNKFQLYLNSLSLQPPHSLCHLAQRPTSQWPSTNSNLSLTDNWLHWCVSLTGCHGNNHICLLILKVSYRDTVHTVLKISFSYPSICSL